MGIVASAEDYWCGQTLRVTVEGPTETRCVEVDKPFARVGSHPASEIVLGGEGVASRALYLHATSDGVYRIDLNSAISAASADGSKHSWLAPDHPILLGAYRLSVESVPSAADARDLPILGSRGSARPPFPIVALSSGDREIGKRRIVRQLTVVGRRRPSAIRLSSRSVSSSHCVLYWDAEMLWVVDLLSSNGTQLNDCPVDVARLTPGDRLRIARIELNYLALSEPNVDRSSPSHVDTPIESERSDELDEFGSEHAESEHAEFEAPVDDHRPVAATDEDPDEMLTRLTDQLIAMERDKTRESRPKRILITLAVILGTSALGAAVWWIVRLYR